MGLLRRSRSATERQELRELARSGSLAEFLGVYRSSDARRPDLGVELLFIAARNKAIDARVSIVGRMLDDGVSGAAIHHGAGILHHLLTYGVHDFPAEAPLLRRLLSAGADINRVDPKRGTPLEALASQFRFSDDQLDPFYDVMLAHPDLDPLQDSVFGRTVLGNVRTWSDGRPKLLARLEQLLVDRGQPVPGSNAPEKLGAKAGGQQPRRVGMTDRGQFRVEGNFVLPSGDVGVYGTVESGTIDFRARIQGPAGTWDLVRMENLRDLISAAHAGDSSIRLILGGARQEDVPAGTILHAL